MNTEKTQMKETEIDGTGIPVCRRRQAIERLLKYNICRKAIATVCVHLF